MKTYMIPSLLPVCIMSAAFIAVSLRILVTQKPILYPARRHWYLMAVFFAASILPSMFVLRSGYSLGTLVIILVCLGQMHRVSNGYNLNGTTPEAFNEALHNSLNKMSLTFTTNLASIKLHEYDNAIEARMMSNNGMTSFHLKNRDDTLEAEIVTQLRKYFQENDVPICKGIVLGYLAMGIVMPLSLLGLCFK